MLQSCLIWACLRFSIFLVIREYSSLFYLYCDGLTCHRSGKELLGHVTISHPLIGDLFGVIYHGWICNWVDQRAVNLGSAGLQGLNAPTDTLTGSTSTSSLVQLVAQWQR